MDFLKICRQIGVKLTPEQEWSCYYLMMHGKRFCVDFGYGNCVQMADEIRRRERDC